MLFNQFKGDIEKKYKSFVYDEDISKLRIALLISIIFYAGFGLVDYLLFKGSTISSAQFNQFFRIRFYYVIPAFVINIICSFHKSFPKIHQPLTMIVYVIAGLGIASMLVSAPTNFSYYGGMFLVFAMGHFVTKLSLLYASLGSVIILLYYNALSILMGADIGKSVIFTYFYIGFVMISIYAMYISENYRRQNYLQTNRLKGDKVILERNLYDNLLEIENANRITIFSLARLAESRDKYTGDHIERVGFLCLELAKNIPEAYYHRNEVDGEYVIKSIELSSTLHDIGKVAIPEHILMKPGSLTLDEMTIMKEHTIIGSDTLKAIKLRYSKNDFVNMGIEICMYHHERWDGRGYPIGLKGEEIPLVARIVTIIDVYDALISERPYKKAMDKDQALLIMIENSGKQFDPTLLNIFVDLINKA